MIFLMRIFAFLVVFTGAVFLVSDTTYAAQLVPCEGAGCKTCHIVQVANDLVKWLVIAMASIGGLVLMYAGVKMVTAGGNPGAIDAAKEMMINMLVGYLILLSAWLVIDTVMKGLVGNTLPGYGPWNEIQCSTDPQSAPLAAPQTVTTGAPTGVSAGGGRAQLGTGPCAPDVVMSGAQAGGYTLTQAQANTLSCIAIAESSCSNRPPGATQPNGQPTSASGMFQIVFGYNDTCHNLNLPVCTEVARSAGFSVTGNLNCSTAFANGRPKPGMETLANACKAAAQNINCNASAAACLLRTPQGYGHWTADSRSVKQRECIARFSN